METKPKTADERDLLGTPLGRLFAAYERKTTLAHVEDGKLGAVDMPSARMLKHVRELWGSADASREAFLAAVNDIRRAHDMPDGSYWADGVVNEVKAAFGSEVGE